MEAVTSYHLWSIGRCWENPRSFWLLFLRNLDNSHSRQAQTWVRDGSSPSILKSSSFHLYLLLFSTFSPRLLPTPPTLYPPSSFCFPSPTGRGTGNRDNSMCMSLHCTTIFGWSSELELAYFCIPLHTLGYVCPPLHTSIHPHTFADYTLHTCLPLSSCIPLCTFAYSQVPPLGHIPRIFARMKASNDAIPKACVQVIHVLADSDVSCKIVKVHICVAEIEDIPLRILVALLCSKCSSVELPLRVGLIRTM